MDISFHTSIQCLGCSFIGSTIALGGSTGDIIILDYLTGEILKTLSLHQHPITCLTFSHDNAYLLSSDISGAARVWKTNIWQVIKYINTIKDFDPEDMEDEFIYVSGEFDLKDEYLLLFGFSSFAIYQVKGWEKIYESDEYVAPVTGAFLGNNEIAVGDAGGSLYKENILSREKTKSVIAGSFIFKVKPDISNRVCYVWDEFRLSVWNFNNNTILQLVPNVRPRSLLGGYYHIETNTLISATGGKDDLELIFTDVKTKSNTKKMLSAKGALRDVALTLDGKNILIALDKRLISMGV
jgi:hypothetical protein